jgi:hypothetical protein
MDPPRMYGPCRLRSSNRRGLIGAYDQFQGSADIAGPGSRRDRSGRHE